MAEFAGRGQSGLSLHQRLASVHSVLQLTADPYETTYSQTIPFVTFFPHKISLTQRNREANGVWGEKSMMGKTFVGINRTTFLIDEEGKFKRIWQQVKPEGHADEILAVLRNE